MPAARQWKAGKGVVVVVLARVPHTAVAGQLAEVVPLVPLFGSLDFLYTFKNANSSTTSLLSICHTSRTYRILAPSFVCLPSVALLVLGVGLGRLLAQLFLPRFPREVPQYPPL